MKTHDDEKANKPHQRHEAGRTDAVVRNVTVLHENAPPEGVGLAPHDLRPRAPVEMEHDLTLTKKPPKTVHEMVQHHFEVAVRFVRSETKVIETFEDSQVWDERIKDMRADGGTKRRRRVLCTFEAWCGGKRVAGLEVQGEVDIPAGAKLTQEKIAELELEAEKEAGMNIRELLEEAIATREEAGK